MSVWSKFAQNIFLQKCLFIQYKFFGVTWLGLTGEIQLTYDISIRCSRVKVYLLATQIYLLLNTYELYLFSG